jgi:hypothetical protein
VHGWFVTEYCPQILEQLDAEGLPAILRIRYKRYSRYTSPFRPLAAS